MADLVEERIGKQLGNYRLLRLLRHNLATDVYLGEHIFLKTLAAIKVLRAQLQPEVLEEFLAETRRFAQLKHPNIVRVLEFGVEDKIPFLVTDYTPDGTLRQIHPRGTRVSEVHVSSYVKQIATALQYIHDQGLSHRAVRPEHMWLASRIRVLLSDFSLSIDTLDQDLKNREEESGELMYVAPEQRQGNPGPASDQYALAVVVYEWLSGELPFQDTSGQLSQQTTFTPITLDTKMSSVSTEVIRILTTALAQEPEHRFSSVTAFAHALEQVLEPVPSPDTTTRNNVNQIALTQPLSPDQQTRKKRSLTVWLTISLILLVLLTSGGILSYNTGLFPFTRQATSTLSTSRAATQTMSVRGTQHAVATFTAKSPQGIYTAATSGSPFISNALTSTWQNTQKKTSSCTFANGTYHMQNSGVYSDLICTERQNTLHNFAFEVEMNIIKGNMAGIAFRSNNAGNHFYLAILTANGSSSYLDMAIYHDNNNQNLLEDLQDTVAPVNAHTYNLLTIVAYEQAFYLYLNKKYMLTVQDATLTTGILGLYMSNNNNVATQVNFRNARIWKL
ncbi:hypothetical protein KDA_38030 [Dictyobacter alpinus]|uniref:Protein kinase domain-containing protein n=1 Tax=Dictyobacter alpinus TaxID=2014873 RepID=A0A402BAG9_9CHLR|nr:serine/threonine-protein kinase [Dictyobacter alpinus]GCE28319.1 hypothetical protein KDA_38030 [Dictyobacter alpinus]